MTTQTVTNPATGNPAGEVDWASAQQVNEAATALRAAQPAWAALKPSERAAIVSKFVDWMIENRPEWEQSLVNEAGKSIRDTQLEFGFIEGVNHFYGRNAEKFLKPEKRKAPSALLGGKPGTVNWAPYPLVGVITPWNFPVALSYGDAIPALIAGCSVLMKPSEETPITVTEIAKGWQEVAPEYDVLRVVNGAGETGSALVDCVDMVQFTGSGRTGSAIMKQAAEKLTPVSLELGGKDPLLVFADADLERAANAAVWGGLVNAGQMCVSVERVYVQEQVYDEFVSILTDKVKALKMGSGEDYDFGSMINETQLGIVDRHVSEAKAAGAKVLTGGNRAPGNGAFYEPTVLVDVNHDMSCMREETFGPTIPVMKFSTTDEAVELANDSEYGLGSSIWTSDLPFARELATRLQAGAVVINDVVSNLSNSSVPHGGWKSSGIGARFGGAAGLHKFCKATAIVENKVPGKSEMYWYSAPAFGPKLADKLAGAHGRWGRNKIKANT